jgi:hypothetical protein
MIHGEGHDACVPMAMGLPLVATITSDPKELRVWAASFMMLWSDRAGLGCFEHHPGEHFMQCFIDRCIDEHGLQRFAQEGLSGVLSASRFLCALPTV